MNENNSILPENNESIEPVSLALNNLEHTSQSTLIHYEEQLILNNLEKNNPLGLSLYVDRKNKDFPQYYIVKENLILKTPLFLQDVSEYLSQIEKLTSIKDPIYIDGKFHFRVIAQDDNWGSYNSAFFKDSIIVKQVDQGTSRLERKNEISYQNNKIEELFAFVKEIRNNPKDKIFARILDENGKIGFKETPTTQHIAKIMEKSNYNIAQK